MNLVWHYNLIYATPTCSPVTLIPTFHETFKLFCCISDDNRGSNSHIVPLEIEGAKLPLCKVAV